MFRKPREDVSCISNVPTTPSVGRPPSPQQSPSVNVNDTGSGGMATRGTTLAQTAVPSPSGSKMIGVTPKNGKAKGNNNGSILSFFKKSDSQPEQSLFMPGGSPAKLARPQLSAHDSFDGDSGSLSPARQVEEDETRYQELGRSMKRRKLSPSPSRGGSSAIPVKADPGMTDREGCSPPPADFNDQRNPTVDGGGTTPNGTTANSDSRRGPFLEESDSEDERPGETMPAGLADTGKPTEEPAANGHVQPTDITQIDDEVSQQQVDHAVDHMRPPRLKRESTSWPEEDDFADLEGGGDFDEEYEDGEEFVERRWVQEQNRLELEGDREDEMDDEGHPTVIKEEPTDEADLPEVDEATTADVAACPICGGSFAGVTDAEASVHVNHCLDGNPTPLPAASTKAESKSKPPVTLEDSTATTPKPPTFRGPDRPAKPGQRNPFQAGETKQSTTSSSSAFSTMMSNHSEETAWATAAASERASHGKPSYQRTCPFYKIMPGLSICVDAFRYGAVAGCNAYFLSHFHSDHYVGLTASWHHGPIYCSGVTGRLVKQQLRVDPRWVVELEFDKRIVVPNTPNVSVTMIPANHCPGSSLYLFENEVPSTNKTGKPRTHRILHCGDFRACPAHIEHPLLAPEVIDKVTGKLAQQKIDVCYLDTTYLNPKYAFPSQEDVIQACADMCVSLNKEQIDENDKFEQAKREKMGGSMVKFVRKDSASNDSPQPQPEASSDTTPTNTTKNPDVPPDLSTFNPFTTAAARPSDKKRGRLLIITGTYSIGKERICLGIARALRSLIYAPPGKQRIVAALQDPELSRLMTNDPLAAQVHMTPIFEIRADTLADYLGQYPPGSFDRIVGFRPSGWNYRPPGGRSTEAPAVGSVLYSEDWKSRFTVKDLVPQRGSSSKAKCFGVPYSEHSSFRELTMFVCALRIGKVVPTVNVGSAKGRERMRGWCERWEAEKRKGGLFRVGGRPVKGEEGEEGVVVKREDGIGEDKGKDKGPEKGAWYPTLGTWELRTTL